MLYFIILYILHAHVQIYVYACARVCTVCNCISFYNVGCVHFRLIC